MGRRERRAAAAKARLSGETARQAQRARSEIREAVEKTGVGIHEKLEEILDAMAGAITHLSTNGDDFAAEVMADAVHAELQSTFKDTARHTFVEQKWMGVTEETVDEKVAEEIVRRSVLQSDLALILSAFDRMAVDVDKARREGQDMIVEAHAAYGRTLGHERTKPVRERLLYAGFRGGVAEALEDIVCAELLDHAEHSAEIALRFGLLPESDKGPAAEEGFRRRLAPEYQALRESDRCMCFVRQGCEAMVEGVEVDWRDLPDRPEDWIRYFTLGVWPEIRELLIKARWRGATEENVDRLLAEEIHRYFAPRREKAVGAIVSEAQVALEEHELPGKAVLVPERQLRLTAQSFDHAIMRVGAELWQKTYARGMGDAEAANVCAGDGRLREVTARFAALWAVHAFQRVQCSHTFAAALMCTDVDAEALHGAQEGWRAWSVLVPTGMLRAKHLEIRRILVAVYDREAMLSLHDFSGQGDAERAVFVLTAPTLAELLTETRHVAGLSDSSLERLIVLGKRLVAGLLLAMQETSDVRVRDIPERAGGYRKGQREEGEPAHRMVVVGRPIKIDCREGIESYLRTGKATRGGRPGLPVVQWIVRGHYRHQACGVGRLGRKLLWIRPFWKGKADAPILTHARKVAG